MTDFLSQMCFVRVYIVYYVYIDTSIIIVSVIDLVCIHALYVM